MKFLFALGVVAAADAARPTHLDGEALFQQHQRILNNPHNQKLFAENEALNRAKPAAVSKPELNLRRTVTLPPSGPVPVEEAYMLLEGYSLPDCSGGTLTMRQAYRLNNCIRGVDTNGHEVSTKYKAWTNPLRIRQLYYDNGNCANEGKFDQDNLLRGLPFDKTYTPGTCAVGAGLIGSFTNTVYPDNYWSGIESTVSGSGFKCGNDDFYELDFSPVGICNEEDDGTSFKYSLDDCSTSGSFTKTIYSDNSCSVFDSAVLISQDFETCRFNFKDYAALTVEEEPVVFYEYASMKCVEAEP